MRSRGQSLVELAVALPLLVMIAFASAQFVRLALERAGLDAATAAAVAAAARSTSASAAAGAGATAFRNVAGAYSLEPSATIGIDTGGFGRGGTVTATGSTTFNLGFSGVPALRLAWRLTSVASARVEDWRSRPAGP